jgi:predicted kinase
MSIELVVLIGLQASGKTTFRRERFDATHVVVSKDLMRNNRRPQRRQMALIEEALAAGRSVVVDNTNPTREDRLPLVNAGRAFGARIVGYFFSSQFEDSVRRNASREGRAQVPEVALRTTAKAFERPRWSEGFDELYVVTIAEGNRFDVQSFVENEDIPNG